MATVHFDNHATARLDPRVLEAMRPYLERPCVNPSSLHRFGRAARGGVDAARVEVAARVGAEPGQWVLTSGGTGHAEVLVTLRALRAEALPA